MAILKLKPKPQPALPTRDRQVSLEGLEDGRVVIKINQLGFTYWVLVLNTDGTFSRVHGPGPDMKRATAYDSYLIRESKPVKRPLDL